MTIFTVSTDEHDIDKLLDEVATALGKWEAGEAVPLDLSVMLGDAGKTDQKARELRSQWQIDGHAVIQSTRPGLGPWVIRFQQMVRRLTWWFMDPILHQIRHFQRNTAVTVADMAQTQTALIQQVETQATEIEALRARLAQLEEQTGALSGTEAS